MYFLLRFICFEVTVQRLEREIGHNITGLAGGMAHAHCLGAPRVKGSDKAKSQTGSSTVLEKALAGMSAWVEV